MMSDQLTNTVAAFQQWRSNKPARSSATPSYLRQQAVALLPHYSQSIIATTLRISGTQLKHWRLAHQALNDTTHFIPLPSLQSEPLPSQSTPALSFEVNLTNGNQFSVSGALDCQLITQLIEAIRS
jgi:hypothetical protein